MIDRPIVPARKVLVVDDDDAFRTALGEALSQHGYEVALAHNGAEALATLKTESPSDLILLDLSMPQMNGWEFRLQQRADPTLARIPVVVLTSNLEAQAAAIDAEAVFDKAVPLKTLTRAMDDLLRANDAERLAQTEKMASLGLLAAGVAHEINNPLAFVLSNLHFAIEELEALKAQPGGSALDEVRAALDEATLGAERVRALVQDLRTFARSEAAQRRPIDLREVIQVAVKMASHEIRFRAELLTELEPVPLIDADEARLGQVFLNLLVNAAQAIPPGHQAENRITVRTKQDAKGRAIAEVQDTGPGIPPAVVERIFEPFFTTKPVGVGTGLGLTICRQVIADHGGEISVQSELGKGTLFRVSLPPLPG